MKKILFILFMVIGVCSCTNLESERYNVINPSIFPANEKDAIALVTAAAYTPFRSNFYAGLYASSVDGIHVVSDMSSDIGDCQWNDSYWPYITNMNFTATSARVTNFYTTYLRDISKMTLTISRIEGVDMPESAKERLIGELRCGRGWLAYYLYDLYGPVPVATLEQLENPLQEEILPRPTAAWMVEYIETELREAIKVLPANYKAGDTNYGRFTAGLCYMVLMKLYMHKGEWGKAEECGRELMKPEYGYELIADYKDIFTLENEKNAEIIWAAQCSHAVNKQLWQAHVFSSEYPTTNPNIQKWGGYRMLWHFYETFDPEDRRLEVLVGEFTGTDGVLYNKENPGTVLIKGAMPIKYGEDPAATGEASQIDWIVYRYADVLLQLSEVIVRKNNAITQEATDLMNQVRTRAGIKPYVLSDFTGVTDFLDKILLNRGQELWFEGHRRTDLIRHGKYIEYARTYKGSVTAQDYMNLMPIPQAAITEGRGIVIQNPGY